jgi:hypothetical protein
MVFVRIGGSVGVTLDVDVGVGVRGDTGITRSVPRQPASTRPARRISRIERSLLLMIASNAENGARIR